MAFPAYLHVLILTDFAHKEEIIVLIIALQKDIALMEYVTVEQDTGGEIVI